MMIKTTTKPLSEIADFILGKMLDQAKNKGDLRPYLANFNVQWGRFHLSNLNEMRFTTAELEKFSLNSGDILMCEGGEAGRCAYWKEHESPVLFQKAIHRIRAGHEIDSAYLYYYFLDFGKKNGFEPYTTGSTIKHLPREQLAKIEVSYPELKVQKKVSSVLSRYDDLIQTNQQRITLLEEAAQRLYDEWFVKLRFPNHEQVPVVDGVPEGWERGTVYDFADILSGGTPKTTNTEFWDGDIPFFTPKDSPSNFFTFSCEKTITQAGLKSCNSPLYPENSLFITARGTVGKICLAGVPMAMNQSCYSIKPKQNFSPYYFYLALQRSIAQIKQTANGGVFDAIIVDTFRSIDMLRPNLHLAESFSVMIEPFFGQMKSLIIQNQKLMQARDDLLPRLMSGRLNVSTLSAVGEE